MRGNVGFEVPQGQTTNFVLQEGTLSAKWANKDVPVKVSEFPRTIFGGSPVSEKNPSRSLGE